MHIEFGQAAAFQRHHGYPVSVSQTPDFTDRRRAIRAALAS